MKNKVEIFISYAWKDADQSIDESREKIVDEICDSFSAKGYEIIRDKNHLTYKQSIKMFMERIGQGNYIIAVVSDKYLKSEYCMYEAYQMFQSRHFRERVFPIVLGDTDIFSIEGQTDYLVFWGQRLNQLQIQAERLKEINQTMTVPLIERRREIELMSYSIADFMATVADMNVLTPEIHSDSDFKALVQAIESKIKTDIPQFLEDSQKASVTKPVAKATKAREVFISYAWGGESEIVVNKLDQILQEKEITVIRDKRGLGFKGSVKDFMQEIGPGKVVIVVISNKYLRSESCMFEFVEISAAGDFYEHIFPIVLPDAEIYKPIKRVRYIQHWENEINELDEAMKSVGSANLQGFRESIDLYTRIRSTIADLTEILKDMNTSTPEIHADSEFEDIMAPIGRKLEL